MSEEKIVLIARLKVKNDKVELARSAAHWQLLSLSGKRPVVLITTFISLLRTKPCSFGMKYG